MKITLFLFFLFVGPPLWSQLQLSKIVQIPWNSHELVVFSGDGYLFPCLKDGGVEPKTGLPFFNYNLPIDGNIDITGVSVVLQGESSPLRSSLINARNVNAIDSFKYSWSVVNESGKRSLLLNCNPLYLNKNGFLTYCKSLIISVEYKVVQSSDLKSASKQPFVEHSLLNQGKWIKVKLDKSGVYQLDYSILSAWGFLNPKNVHVYGSGGKMLTKINSLNKVDDLEEISLYDNGRALLFYGEGVVTWDYNHNYEMFIHAQNLYDTHSYYFITETTQPTQSMPILPSLNEFDYISKVYTGMDYHESNSVNLIKSGKQWLGEEFSKNGNHLTQSFSFNTQDATRTVENNLKFYAEVVARSDKNSSFYFSVNGETESGQLLSCTSVILGSTTERYADERKISFNGSTNQLKTDLTISFTPQSNSSVGWLNFISLNSRKNLIFRNSWLSFRDPEILVEGSRTQFKMAGVKGKSIVIWDITDVLNCKSIPITQLDDTLSFVVEKGRFQEFLAFDKNATFPTPTFVEVVANQDLHGLPQTEYVIVTPNQFLTEANALADIHRKYNNINPTVIALESLYNEFSSGKQDPVAIRSLMRMFYSRSSVGDAITPKFLLLYGDGSYDNLGINASNKSKVVTYQSDKSFHLTDSYVSDDFFGFLDDSEGGSEVYDKLDIGIGRFVVNNSIEARIANAKVKSYLTDQDREEWQTRISFLAQDGNDNLHQTDAEELATVVRANNPEFNLNKIYADAYPKVGNTSSGTFPEADKAINKALNIDGTLIFNYTGHGAVDRIDCGFLNIEKVNNLTNLKRLPLFVTATCEISRFDNPEETSMGEHVFLNPLGGGIGLLSTTRVVYSFFNKNLNLNFYKNIFLKDSNNQPLRLGEVMMRTKNSSISSINKLNFTLLCDPALRLNYPVNNAEVGSIENVVVNQVVDTIHGLTHGVLSGTVLNRNGLLNQNFNGTATLSIYDKGSSVKTLGNGGQKPFVFEDYQSVLYKGNVDVKGGEFKSEFIIPSDIRYDYGKGRITLFCSSDSTSAFGYNNSYVVGGLDENAEYDDIAPELSLFLNSTSFINGGKCGSSPIFIANISDKQGINIAGAGIGHDLLLTIDENPYSSFILNNNFSFYKDSYQSGEVRYQLSALSPGMHSISFRVWDCNNNSTTKSLTFEVIDDSNLRIDNIALYPNPVKQERNLNVLFTHDEPNTNLDILMEVYAMDGRLVHRSTHERADKNGIIAPIEWLPTSIGGGKLDLGIYLCKLWVTSSTGQNSNFSKRFVVIQ